MIDDAHGHEVHLALNRALNLRVSAPARTRTLEAEVTKKVRVVGLGVLESESGARESGRR